VYLTETGAPADLKKADETTPINNPFTISDDNYNLDGSFWFKAANDTYNIKIVNGADIKWKYGRVLFDFNDDYPISQLKFIPKRQCILNAPLDANGLVTLGGSTGSTTLTTTDIADFQSLIVTAGNGFNLNGAIDVIGQSENDLSWTGLSVDGNMYLYVDIDEDGVLTTGSTTLLPVYNIGPTFDISDEQFTYNIPMNIGEVGVGGGTIQVTRVFVGEAFVGGGTVSSFLWYALRGKYSGSYNLTVPSGIVISRNSNLGTDTDIDYYMEIKCISNDPNTLHNPGDIVKVKEYFTGSAGAALTAFVTRNTVSIAMSGLPYLSKKSAIGSNAILASRWKYKLVARRTW
jgi:hypothetical protein